MRPRGIPGTDPEGKAGTGDLLGLALASPVPADALGGDFYDRPASEVARALLGALLISDVGGERTAGLIVETEAYEGPEDPASHAWGRTGRTARNDPLFGPPGTSYFHLNYGVHWCFNAVTAAEGVPHGVLVRALEPCAGLAAMRRRRGRDDLTSGPARLVQALGLGPDLQRHALWAAPLWLSPGRPVPDSAVVQTTRIGIRRGASTPWRFYDRRSVWVSRR